MLRHLAVRPAQGKNALSCLEQRIHQMSANEAAGSGYETVGRRKSCRR
jgi:hypothetical protein